MSSNLLIVYFSQSNHTRQLAQAIQRQTGGALAELLPDPPYPAAYRAVVQRGQEELCTGNLPPLHPSVGQLDRYDTLLIGTPNWFGTIAPPVQTFLKDSDLSGKRVAPFCTNGGGGFGTIPQDLERMCPASICLPGLQVSSSGVSEEQLSHWLRQIGVL